MPVLEPHDLLLPQFWFLHYTWKQILKMNNSTHQGLLWSSANPVPQLPELLQVEDVTTPCPFKSIVFHMILYLPPIISHNFYQATIHTCIIIYCTGFIAINKHSGLRLFKARRMISSSPKSDFTISLETTSWSWQFNIQGSSSTLQYPSHSCRNP